MAFDERGFFACRGTRERQRLARLNDALQLLWLEAQQSSNFSERFLRQLHSVARSKDDIEPSLPLFQFAERRLLQRGVDLRRGQLGSAVETACACRRVGAQTDFTRHHLLRRKATRLRTQRLDVAQ